VLIQRHVSHAVDCAVFTRLSPQQAPRSVRSLTCLLTRHTSPWMEIVRCVAIYEGGMRIDPGLLSRTRRGLSTPDRASLGRAQDEPSFCEWMRAIPLAPPPADSFGMFMQKAADVSLA
jgi:hypothetical protein